MKYPTRRKASQVEGVRAKRFGVAPVLGSLLTGTW
jgi:hypothetical protein